VAELASRQFGVVARTQLRELGLGREAINFGIRIGRLHRLYRGVFAVGHRRISIAGWRMASVLTYGDDGVVSHRAAGAHWNLRQSRAIEVTLPRTARPRQGLVLHRLPLPADEVTVHKGIPVTTVPRTMFDLAADLGRRGVVTLIHEAGHQNLTDPLSLAHLVERYPDRKGVAVVRAALEEYYAGAGITQNDFEEAMFAFLEERGFPRPECNAWVQVGDRWIKPDFVWRKQMVIVETDGGTHRTPYGQRKDNARDRLAQANGWILMRVSWWALHNEADDIDRDLKQALQR
jgi:very-short-patch-repair endonuclease